MKTRCRFLEWDSAFFGRRIARLDGDRLDPAELGALNEWCAAQQIDCLYFLAHSNCPATIAAAEQGGFACTDLRMTYEWKASLRAPGLAPQIGSRVSVQALGQSDADALIPIAREAHTESRFFFDRHFVPAQAALLYETWIRQACARDHVLVGRLGGQIAGYLTCQRSGPHSGSIGLAAVEKRFHGQGIGRAMMEAALGWFAREGITEISVVTQGRNVAAHRFYQSAGFLTRSIECWFHKWFAPAAYTGHPSAPACRLSS